jgi:hypothetical protein
MCGGTSNGVSVCKDAIHKDAQFDAPPPISHPPTNPLTTTLTSCRSLSDRLRVLEDTLASKDGVIAQLRDALASGEAQHQQVCVDVA